MRNPELLHIKTIDGEWCDKDIVMLHACFQLLTDFVEQEISQNIVDWQHDESVKKARIEIDELYNWWKQRLLLDQEGKIDSINDDSQRKVDDAMLIRLINIRGYLWT